MEFNLFMVQGVPGCNFSMKPISQTSAQLCIPPFWLTLLAVSPWIFDRVFKSIARFDSYRIIFFFSSPTTTEFNIQFFDQFFPYIDFPENICAVTLGTSLSRELSRDKRYTASLRISSYIRHEVSGWGRLLTLFLQNDSCFFRKVINECSRKWCGEIPSRLRQSKRHKLEERIRICGKNNGNFSWLFL